MSVYLMTIHPIKIFIHLDRSGGPTKKHATSAAKMWPFS